MSEQTIDSEPSGKPEAGPKRPRKPAKGAKPAKKVGRAKKPATKPKPGRAERLASTSVKAIVTVDLSCFRQIWRRTH